MRQLRQDERDEDVVGVLGLGARVGGHEGGLGLGADRIGAMAGRDHGGPRARFPRGVVRRAGLEPHANRGLALRDGAGVLGLDGAESAVLLVAAPLRLVEEHRVRCELVEDEQERAQQQDDELHRDLQHRVEHQAQATLAQRGAADVALHLRLVGAEVGEGEEQPAEHAGPHRVAPARIEGEVHRLQLAQRAGHVRGTGESEAVGQPEQQHDHGRHHAGRDHRHLPLVGQGDGFAAAGDRVDDHEQPGKDDDQVERPAEDRRDDDRGRVDRHAGGQPALQQEEAGAEQARLLVEPLAEELVGGVDVEPPVHGQEHGAHDDERQRQAEVVLHEADAALEALAREREERDRARLRGHHAEADRAPAGGRVAAQVRVEAPHVARAPGPVRGDAHDGAEQHDPVGDVHAKIPVNTVSRTTTSTNHPNTNR